MVRALRWNDILFWVPEKKKKKKTSPHPISSIIYFILSMKMSVPMHEASGKASGYVRKGRAYKIGLFHHVPSCKHPHRRNQSKKAAAPSEPGEFYRRGQ